jgi:hypothetical protein
VKTYFPRTLVNKGRSAPIRDRRPSCRHTASLVEVLGAGGSPNLCMRVHLKRHPDVVVPSPSGLNRMRFEELVDHYRVLGSFLR